MSQKCPDCNGTGRCKECGGTGKTPFGNKCPACATGDWHGRPLYTDKDRGSGVCSTCHGKGEV